MNSTDNRHCYTEIGFIDNGRWKCYKSFFSLKIWSDFVTFIYNFYINFIRMCLYCHSNDPKHIEDSKNFSLTVKDQVCSTNIQAFLLPWLDSFIFLLVNGRLYIMERDIYQSWNDSKIWRKIIFTRKDKKNEMFKSMIIKNNTCIWL